MTRVDLAIPCRRGVDPAHVREMAEREAGAPVRFVRTQLGGHLGGVQLPSDLVAHWFSTGVPRGAEDVD